MLVTSSTSVILLNAHNVEGSCIALKVNYGFERAQRKRAKDLKKQEKLRRREEETARRKALKEVQSSSGSDDVSGDEVPAADVPTKADGE